MSSGSKIKLACPNFLEYIPAIRELFLDVALFSEHISMVKLRGYQVDVAQAIADSVVKKKGLTFVVIFPRQSGKNELQAGIEIYLLTVLQKEHAEIVKVSPTWKPQSLNAMRRLEGILSQNLLTREFWSKEQGFIYRLSTARVYFLSGQPSANIVGATASTLLECDEAQDVLISKWDKEISPMAASTNATRVFWGTAWTSATLLAREKRAALDAQQQDGIQRVFEIDAQVVGAEVPAYAAFVQGEIEKLGRGHPFIRTQYFSEEIDAQGGMFPPERQVLMRGDHPPLLSPRPGFAYAFLLDVAGGDEAATDLGGGLDYTADLRNPGRDATALTILEIDTSTLSDELIRAPSYLVVARKLWIGTSHSGLYAQIKALIAHWQPRYLVIDATGVGAGLASFLSRAYPQKVIPFQFNASSKSKLGWDFLAIIETGRFKDHHPSENSPEQAVFWQQVEHARMDIRPGPQRTMKWGVPDSMRDPRTGELIHDDLLISAALCSLLDDCSWGQALSAIIPFDPLADLPPVY